MSEEQIEEILKHMCKFKNEPYTNISCDKCVLNNTCHYQNIAREMQNSDMVKVVRCKDCEYFYKPYEESVYCYCTHEQWSDTLDGNGTRVSENDFCSYGERKI